MIKKSRIITCILFLVATLLVFSACGGGIEFRFETNGGAPIESVTVEAGQDFTLPTPEPREGYSFGGWYRDEALTDGPVSTVVAESSATFYAKWEEAASITLELGGGTLSNGATKLSLRVGANLYDFMKDYVPTLADHKFGAWFAGETELTPGTLMPAGGITLTARYQVAYTVEVFFQNLSLDGYERGENVTGYDYAGKTVTPELSFTGFEISDEDNGDAVTSLELKEPASQNIFRVYLDRISYGVVFMPDFPDGAQGEGERLVEYYPYGTEISVPVGAFSLHGYYLVGYTIDGGGDVIYETNELFGLLQNRHEETSPDKLTVEKELVLRAVWNRGYADIFGGGDVLYLLGTDADVIYLERGGYFFEGKYNSARKTFTFESENGSLLFEGRINSNGTFSYYDTTRAGYSAKLYTMGVGIDENITIYFDPYNGVTYEDKTENAGGERSSGTYEVQPSEEEGGFELYLATFTSGPKAGEEMNFRRGFVQGTPAFQIRDEEAFGWGSLVCGALYNGSLSYYINGVYELTLDGFGTASYNNGSSLVTYYYTREENEITVIDSASGAVSWIAHKVEIHNENGYIRYDSAHDFSATEENGATLTLDGYLNATYSVDGTSMTGYYTTMSSAFGTIVRVSGISDRSFLIRTVTDTEIDEEGNPSTVTRYTFEEKAAGYAEYYYFHGAVQNAPFIVLNEPSEGQATIYGYTVDRTYEKILVGNFVGTEPGLFSFETSSVFETEAELAEGEFEISSVKFFVFRLGEVSTLFGTYNVSYWYGVRLADGTETKYGEAFEGPDSETLTLVSGFAVYKNAEGVFAGTYTESEGLITFSAEGESFHFELDRENKRFTRLTELYGTVRERLATGEVTSVNTLSFDGKGGAVYTMGENVYTGRYTLEDGVYTFTAQGMEFEFIFLTASNNTVYFARRSVEVSGIYDSEEGETIELDGYSFRITYSTLNGEVLSGQYVIREENVVLATFDEVTYYFDLSGRSFTVRGQEFASYLYIDNYGFDGKYLDFDGYGNLVVYTFRATGEEGESERVVIDEKAVYTIAGDVVTLTFTENGIRKEAKGTFGTIQIGSTLYRAFLVAHDELLTSYLDKDGFTVLTIDAYGHAVRYNKTGKEERGQYVLITESLLYFAKDDGSDACIYYYDNEKGAVTQVTFQTKGYYTEDLKSLLFSPYGFMIMNGETRCYYYVESDGNVSLYRQDAENPDANRYGFVKIDFGAFEDTKEFEGKTYRQQDGYAITFKREQSNEGKYPIILQAYDEDNQIIDVALNLGDLNFVPGGSLEFSVNGVVTLNSELSNDNYNCVVTRTRLESGDLIVYLTISNYYRFVIKVNYLGDQNGTYTVESLSYRQSVASYTYWSYYYLYLVFMGTAIGNNFGVVTIVRDYDEQGAVSREYVVGQFGINSGMFDSNGSLIEEIEADYTSVETGVYELLFEAEDGYKYRMTFGIYRHSSLNVLGYRLFTLTRLEELDLGDGYHMTLERVIASDTGVAVGSVVSPVLTKDGEEITSYVSYFNAARNKIYYLVGEEDENGRVSDLTYYLISLENKEIDEENENASRIRVPAIKSATIESKQAKRVYSADGNSYMDISGNEVFLLFDNGTGMFVSGTSYDEGTHTYTLTISETISYRVKVENETIVEMERIESTEE